MEPFKFTEKGVIRTNEDNAMMEILQNLVDLSLSASKISNEKRSGCNDYEAELLFLYLDELSCTYRKLFRFLDSTKTGSFSSDIPSNFWR
jgi:hypothetical protein